MSYIIDLSLQRHPPNKLFFFQLQKVFGVQSEVHCNKWKSFHWHELTSYLFLPILCILMKTGINLDLLLYKSTSSQETEWKIWRPHASSFCSRKSVFISLYSVFVAIRENILHFSLSILNRNKFPIILDSLDPLFLTVPWKNLQSLPT